MMRPEPLPPLPPSLEDADGALVHGRFAGRLSTDPLALGPRRPRARRWRYAAAGGRDAAVGAALVHLGAVAVAFAWARVGTSTLTFERRLPFGRGLALERSLDEGAALHGGGAHLRIGGDGAIDLDVPTAAGRLAAWVRTTDDVTPAVVVTPTAGGGWNSTQKAAGTAVEGWVRVAGGPPVAFGDGASGWRDATAGRQDRTTVWRWAAGGGLEDGLGGGGRRVGLNVSTGMNAAGVGEDVVWWDGVPYGLAVTDLRPVDEAVPEGAWQVAGPGWSLSFEPQGVRAKDERLPFVRSRYVQPIGRFSGTLPDPSGTLVEVELTGVTEDHLAVW